MGSPILRIYYFWLMIDFKFHPESYFTDETTSVLLVKLSYPESQWGEQISIYAHSLDGKIQFEAVDFYGNDYILYPSWSYEVLSMEDLIYLLEAMQVNTDAMEGNMELILDGIPEVESDFYPGLGEYFEEKRKNVGLD
ncbi:UDP-glucuronosyltransferase [Algoriphagus sp. AGSA1]|uniref:UDP-glucuronosyltransferase n=1 Tax=Algoriphagus sp. AGSA1 TaxID=2907213 RepID=UPI001F23E2C6|nr:UDP-glucuronosyltransferase [Algoriphagus sp. AGSA1]MCE7056365.1 UDP-glucuronosyltransferase [Algoriphagus sp. AGSA1]